MTIGPPLPPHLAARRRDAPDPAGGPASPPRPPSIGPPRPPSIGPPRPPSIGPPRPPTIGPPRPSAIGPALPPALGGAAAATLSRKRDWERVRAEAAVPAAAPPPAHPGDEGREEWMTVAPAADRGAAMAAARGFSSARAAGAAAAVRGGAAAGCAAPVLATDAVYDGAGAGPGSGEEAEEDDEEAEEGRGEEEGRNEGGGAAKRARVSDGPSLLERHRSTAKEAAEAAAAAGVRPARHRQFDREREFVNHKKRDASFYVARGGGLGSRYGAGSRQGE